MIKNLNDYINILVLIIMTYFSLSILVSAFIHKNTNIEKREYSLKELLSTYLDNEDE